MKVLSLFDGISCGMVALERVGIPVERYVAYEIEDFAIKVSKKNYPFIEHNGDVFNGDFSQYSDFDLLIGCSPCTFWSNARAKGTGRELTPDGEGGKLFMQFVRALSEAKRHEKLLCKARNQHKESKTIDNRSKQKSRNYNLCER